MSNLTIRLFAISKEFVEAEDTKQREETGVDKDVLRAMVIRGDYDHGYESERRTLLQINIVRTFTPPKSD